MDNDTMDYINISGCSLENTIHIQTDEAAETFLNSDLAYLLAVAVVPIIIALGAFGNIAFFIMLYRLPYMRTTVNLYLASLATVDLVYVLTVPSIFIYAIVNSPLSGDFPFPGRYSCATFFFFGYACYYFSIALLTVISFERYVAICRPIHHIKTQGRSRTLALISAAGILSIVLAAVTLPRRGQQVVRCLIWPEGELYLEFPTTMYSCEPLGNEKVIITFTDIVYVGFFFVALITSGYCYIKIIIALSNRHSDVADRSSNNPTPQFIAVRNQVTRALVTLGAVYFITQTPIRITDINEVLEQFGPGFLTKDQAGFIESIGFLFLFFNSAVNSYIYIFCSSFYRRAFVEAFTGHAGRGSKASGTPNSSTKQTKT